jgi:hypothetical protein
VREVDNLTVICMGFVENLWEPEPRRLATVWAFTACYRDSSALFFIEKVVLTFLVSFSRSEQLHLISLY